jgi:hypothetical protein
MLLAAIGGLGLTSACFGQDATSNKSVPLAVYHSAQGNNLGIAVDTTPRMSSYALTGEATDYPQAAQTWQKNAGPLFISVNGVRVMVDPAR